MTSARVSQPVQKTTDSRGDAAARPERGSGLRSALRGADFATGEAMLAPPVQRKAAGSVVQMDEAQDKKTATELETKDKGHSLDRHGPELSDQSLKDRLTTGVAPDGKVSPAPGLSTKFAKYEDYLLTRAAAANLMGAGLTKAQTTLQGKIDALKTAKAAFDTEPPGPGKGLKSKDVATAKTNLKAEVGKIGQASADTAPVKFVQGGKEPEDMVLLYNGYGVVLDHGRAIGSGFEGEDEKTAPHPEDSSKDDITVYGKTKAISGGVSQTQTSFDCPTQGAKLFGVGHTPTAWKAGQHFPTKGQTVGISI